MTDRGVFFGCADHTAVVRALPERAPDLRLKGDFWGRSAHRFARRKGCDEMVDLLGGGEDLG